MTTMKTITIMEKTKFEKECADMCADCHAKGLDICREDADTVQPAGLKDMTSAGTMWIPNW